MFDLTDFISDTITKRSVSLFVSDIENNYDLLKSKIENKSVLVIGGAGTIGSNFIKALLPFCPRILVVVDINENSLTELTRDLRSTKDIFIPDEFITYPMDYSSEVFRKMFRKYKGFNIVANFSAHKHVRSEKDIYSIEALLKNNVINLKGLLDLLSEYPPEEYFCVSTDKAANPVNVMGASKRIMEDVIFGYSDRFPVKTARFANVAFSNGSLLDGFLKRLDKHQPLSAPYDVKRYFVSPEESGQICLLACILGENRDIFFPKLHKEQMMSFDEICLDLLKAYGYKAKICNSENEAIALSTQLHISNNEYPVYFSSSDTSGEKQYEEFFTEKEIVDNTRFVSLGVIKNITFTNFNEVETLIESLIKEFNNSYVTKDMIIEILQGYLPEFKHIETGRSLDNKM